MPAALDKKEISSLYESLATSLPYAAYLALSRPVDFFSDHYKMLALQDYCMIKVMQPILERPVALVRPRWSFYSCAYT